SPDSPPKASWPSCTSEADHTNREKRDEVAGTYAGHRFPEDWSPTFQITDTPGPIRAVGNLDHNQRAGHIAWRGIVPPEPSRGRVCCLVVCRADPLTLNHPDSLPQLRPSRANHRSCGGVHDAIRNRRLLHAE